MKPAIAAAMVVFFLCPVSARQAADPPLPNFEAVWKAVKPHLMQQYDDSELLKGYTYHRTSVVTQMGKGDATKGTSQLGFEVYQFDNGPYNKLISRNGVPLSAQELKRQDDNFAKFKKGGSHRPPWRGGLHKRSAKEQDELLSDVYNAFDFTVLRREIREGRNTIVVDFKPRKNPDLKTMAGKFFLKKAAGTAWVDEEEYVLAKVDFELIQDSKLGGGLIVNINDGSQITREWRKVNDELWLPASSELRLKARAFVSKGYNFRQVDQYSDYKKFSVETRITP